MKKSSTLARAALAFSAMTAAGPALAQDAPDWAFQVTPYVWATGVGGDIRPFRTAPQISFDSSFSDLLEDLDAAVFLSGFVRYNRFVMLGDISYSKSSRSGTIPPGIGAGASLEQASLTLAAGYRIINEPAVAVDVLAGARHWLVKGSVSVPFVGLSVSPRLSFTDPILAVRANVALTPRWSVIAYGDYGGFGVGSEQTSQFFATLNYQLNEAVFLSAGYRALNIDYQSGGTRVDATMHGPLLGATWKF